MFDTWPIYVDESPNPKEFFQQSDTNTFDITMRDAFKIVAKTDTPQHQLHLENFFDTIRGKAQLNCSGEKGYETAVTVLKVNEAIEAARKIEFRSEDFTV